MAADFGRYIHVPESVVESLDSTVKYLRASQVNFTVNIDICGIMSVETDWVRYEYDNMGRFLRFQSVAGKVNANQNIGTASAGGYNPAQHQAGHPIHGSCICGAYPWVHPKGDGCASQGAPVPGRDGNAGVPVAGDEGVDRVRTDGYTANLRAGVCLRCFQPIELNQECAFEGLRPLCHACFRKERVKVLAEKIRGINTL